VQTRANRRRVQLQPILDEEQQGLEMLIETEGSLSDKALGLTQQLEECLKGFVEVEVDGEGEKKVEEDGEGEKKDEEEEETVKNQNTIINAIRSFREQVKDNKSSVRSCVVLLGHNGGGKSFFINMALQVCVPD
jgi:translation initiation factor RLI1